MSTELVLLIGIPGSGKSTLAASMTRDGTHYRVNKDDLREMLGVTTFSRASENLVKSLERSLVKKLLENDVSVVVDNTHLSGDHREFYAQLARDIGKVKGEKVEYREVVLEDSYNLDLCKVRVALRNTKPGAHRVPLEVVVSMHEKFVAQNSKGK